MNPFQTHAAAAALLCATILAPVARAAAAEPAGEKIGDVAVPPGMRVETATAAGGVEVKYLLSEPAKRIEEAPEAGHPAVFLLSRGDRAATGEALLKAWLELAGKHGFLLAWTPAEGMPARQTVDLQRVLAVLADVEKKARVDAKRVYLAGFGHGACAAWDAAMRRPERVRALVSVNGIALRRLYAPASRVAVYAIHGERARIPVTARQGCESDATLRALRAGHVYEEVAGAGDEVAAYLEAMKRAAEWLAKLETREGKGETCSEILAARHALVRVRTAAKKGMTAAKVGAILGPPQGRADTKGKPPQYALIWSQDLARKNLYVVLFEARDGDGADDEAVHATVQAQDVPLPPLELKTVPAPAPDAEAAPAP